MPRRRALDRSPRVSPAGGLVLDRKSPLAEGLRFYAVASAGALLDLALPRASTASFCQGSPAGLSAQGGTFANARTTDLDFTSGGWSVAAYFFQSAALASGEYLNAFQRAVYTNETTNTGWELALVPPDDSNPSKFSFDSFKNNGGGSYRCYSGTTHGVGLWGVAGTSAGSARRDIYVQGLVQSPGSLFNFNPASSSGALLVGGSAKVRPLMAAAWARQLSATEVREIYCRPFVLAVPARPVTYFLAASSSASPDPSIPPSAPAGVPDVVFYASIDPAAQVDGIIYSSAVLLPAAEADLATPDSGLDDPAVCPYAQAAIATVLFRATATLASNTSYVVLQGDNGDGNWFDLAWCTWTATTGAAAFLLFAGAFTGGSVQLTRVTGTAPSPTQGSISCPLPGRLRFVGKATVGAGSSSSSARSSPSPAAAAGVEVAIRLKLLGLR